MFDNPKKELERLEQQLLEAGAQNAEDLSDEIYDELDLEDAVAFSRRSAGFDIEADDYEMDARRYVSASRKKRSKGPLVTFLKIGLVFALFAWWKGWL